MKFRPQVQLRFRDEAQYEAVKAAAVNCGVSVNEYIVQNLEKVAKNGRVAKQVVSVSMEPDGAQGPVVPSSGAREDEQHVGAVSGRVQSSYEPKRAKGSTGESGKTLSKSEQVAALRIRNAGR